MSTAPTITRGNGKLSLISNPIVQAGFAGLCVVLIGIICWRMYCGDQQFRDLMVMQGQTNSVIEKNTAAIRDLSRIVMDKL